LLDRVRRHVGRAPAVGGQAIRARRGGEEQQGLAEGVELKLLVGVVADGVAPAGVPGEVEALLVGTRSASIVYAGASLGPCSSSRAETKPTASSSRSPAPTVAAACPAWHWSRIQT
jgi:hypothetical protein